MSGLDLLQQEIGVMRHLYHRNVVLLFEVLDDLDADHVGLVTEVSGSGVYT